MSDAKTIIVSVQSPEQAKAKAVIDQLEALLAENEKQHDQMVQGAKTATTANTVEFYTGMQAAYAQYGDGLRDALTVIRNTFEIPEDSYDG